MVISSASNGEQGVSWNVNDGDPEPSAVHLAVYLQHHHKHQRQHRSDGVCLAVDLCAPIPPESTS